MIAPTEDAILPRLALAGGGTAGHVYPAASVAAGAAREMVWLGREKGMEQSLAASLGIRFAPIEAGAVVGRGPLALLVSAVRNVRGILQARSVLGDTRPDALLATGGYVSVPSVIAAWSLGIPAVIFLPDIEPGLAVRVLARFARRVACTAADTRRYLPPDRVVPTGYPIRQALRDAASRPDRKARARGALSLGPEPVVAVIGGSQGAHAINEAIWREIDRLTEVAHVIHVTGPRDAAHAADVADRLPRDRSDRYRCHGYVTDALGDILAAADLFVGRAGASVLGELPAFALPALLIPGAFAGGHQRANADYLARAGAAWIFDGALPNGARALADEIVTAVTHPNRLREASHAAGALDVPDAAERIRRVLASVGGADDR